MPLMVLNEQQRQVYVKVGKILLAESPELDAKERVGLLTVLAGARRIAVFLGIESPNQVELSRALRSSGMKPIIAAGPKVAYRWESGYPAEIEDLFRNRDVKPAFWICRNAEDVRVVAKGLDQVAVGGLLGYPICCIEAQQQLQAALERAVIPAYIRCFGENPKEIAEALRTNRKVKMEWEPDNRLDRTNTDFLSFSTSPAKAASIQSLHRA